MSSFIVALSASLLMLPVAGAITESLEGEALSAFNDVCPGENTRAVYAERLPGFLEGWVNLVCLDETQQQTKSWYVNPAGEVLDPNVVFLPEQPRPTAQPELIDRIEQMDDDAQITLWLDFVIEEPVVGSNEDFGGPSGGVSGSSSVGGSGELPINTYEINGVPASEAEYLAWVQADRIAGQARSAELRRLRRELTVVRLHELTELNQWHDWLDITLLDSGESLVIKWAFQEYSNTLELKLTGIQAKQLLVTAPGIVFFEEALEPSIDGGTTDNGDAVISNNNAELTINQTDVNDMPLNDPVGSIDSSDNETNETSGSGRSGLGAIELWFVIFLGLSGLRRFIVSN